MTDMAPFRKALILCAAAMCAASLTACDNQNLKESLARIKEIPVDDSGANQSADAKSLSKEDVQLVVNTAKDLTVGKGGLLRDGDGPIARPKVRIAIVDPLKMPTEANAPLETEVPASEPAPQPVTTVVTTRGNRVIQVGSFGSAEAAQNAWLGLQARYPGVEQYHPVYQKITTASGKSMVRLKVGPVASEDQAHSLCLQLDIRDSWCSKAS
ncbi:SPOR domain-containing protein [Asticcacaulis taihuensis]|uniref:SPOR domain-containing protein n=1 Tax=Asticcacaulis taihuensis TaxID=260084 RepID=UPI0026EB7E58|nr:SPOR domain-containing protein [Asticcacaulis taihuensis]